MRVVRERKETAKASIPSEKLLQIIQGEIKMKKTTIRLNNYFCAWRKYSQNYRTIDLVNTQACPAIQYHSV